MVTGVDGRFIRDDQFQLLQNLMFEDGQWRKRLGLEDLYLSNPDTTDIQYRIYYSGAGGFANGDAVTGAVSGTVGQVVDTQATYLRLSTLVSGDFIIGEAISGAPSGGSGTVTQVQVPLQGTILGLWRLYKPNGDKYSLCVDVDITTHNCRLLMKKNDTIVPSTPPVGWKVIDKNFNVNATGAELSYYFTALFGDKLILTDGRGDVRFFEEQDGTNIVRGRLGALPPKRQSSIGTTKWGSDTIIDGGFVRYCTVYVYEDEDGKVSFSNPSPRTAIYAGDWMGKAHNGIPFSSPGLEDPVILKQVGMEQLEINNIPVGTEYQSSATDTNQIKRIIRRDVYRQVKRFADELFQSWEKIGEERIIEGEGGEEFLDQDLDPPRTPLDIDNFAPPKSRYPLTHKNHLMLYNYTEDDIIAPSDQSDETYEYYEAFGLLKRSTLVVKNNTNRGYTDAIVRIKLQWHTSTGVGYIDFDDTVANAERRIRFTDSDGKTIIPHYIESYNNVFPAAGGLGVGAATHSNAAVDEMVVVLRVPEIVAGSSARLYAYYNSGSPVVDVSDWTAVYHRRHAHSGMNNLLNFDDDLPSEFDFPFDVPPVADKIKFYEMTKEDAEWDTELSLNDGDAMRYANDPGKSGTAFGEKTLRIQDARSTLFLPEILPDPQSVGTIQFFFRVVTIHAAPAVSLIFGSMPPLRQGLDVGIRVKYTAAGTVLRIEWGTGNAEIVDDVTDGNWRFVSIGWGTDDKHMYYREVGGNITYDIDGSLVAITVPGGGHSFGRTSPIQWGLEDGYLDELTVLEYCNTPEETEQVFRRQNLDSYFYDITNANGDVEGAGYGWNLATATCSINTLDHKDVGDSGDRKPTGLAISDGDNPHVFSFRNRRSIGDGTGEGTGITELNGSVFAYKDNGIYRVRTDGELSQWIADDAPVDESKGIGCVSPMTLRRASIRTPGAGWREADIFLSEDGLYAYFGGGEFLELSKNISDVFDGLDGEQLASCTGLVWRAKGKHNVYVLGIAETERADIATEGELERHSPTYYVADKCYVFDLDIPEGGVRISKLTTKQAAGFILGYPVQWESGKGKDNSEMLFANGQSAYIYVWGQRTGNDKYVDTWTLTGGADVDGNIPVALRTRKFWHESAMFRGMKVFYRGQRLDGATMKWYNNILQAIPRTYDEVAFESGESDDPVTHAGTANIESGGVRGKFTLLPKAAKGEWFDVLIEDQVTVINHDGADLYDDAETLTGGTSGATATVVSHSSGVVVITSVVGVFVVGEAITGSVSEDTAASVNFGNFADGDLKWDGFAYEFTNLPRS
jgi:hypothetical protein